MHLKIDHMGMSGLRLTLDDAVLCVDPPGRGPEPAIVSWTEAERVSGVGDRALAALPAVLKWLERPGVALSLVGPVAVGPWQVAALPYTPIPYAVPAEAVRKTLIGLRRPGFAVRRLAHTLRRPKAPPVALRLDCGGVRVALCQQALHRFVGEADLDRLLRFFAGSTVAVASPDYEDEVACGRLLARLDAPQRVLVDSIGPVRRMLGLPTRPLSASVTGTPPGTLLVEDGETVQIEL